MPFETTGASQRERLLEAAVEAYLEASSEGPMDRMELLARYPELAGELQEFFASLDQVCEQIGPLCQAVRAYSGRNLETSTDGQVLAANFTSEGKILGDYEILAPIACGGMGIVYKARQRSLNRTVALKRVLAGQSASFLAVQRFLAEAEAAARMDHPNIVPIYEVGKWHAGDEGPPIYYFSMKLIEGGSLARHLPHFTRDPRAAAQLLATVARAVHYAHQRGIMHRDLKPTNILLEKTPQTTAEHGKPYITDFGLAKRLECDNGLTFTGQVTGTPRYMAPEVAAGQKSVTTAVDVYSLGVILYEILTGRCPFGAETPLQTMRQIQEQEPLRPGALVPHLDHDLETICLKCLDKEPQRRYGSAEALAEDLERWLAGQPIQARRCSRWEQLRKWARRRPTTAALLAAVFLVGAVGLGGVFWSWRAAEEARHQLVLDRYYDHIALAEREWSANNASRANELLDGCPVNLRGWEWYYLKRLNCAPPLTLQGHDSAVYRVAFSPDGRLLVCGNADGTLKFWDTVTWNEIDVFKAHTGPVRTVTFRPDGLWLATIGHDKLVKIWDTVSRQLLLTLEGHQVPLWSVAFSPDGTRLASSGGTDGANGLGEVRVWDALSGALVHSMEGFSQRVWTVAFSPDGKYLAGGGRDQTVRLWDVASGRETRVLREHTMPVLSVVFSPDGQRLASAASTFDSEAKGELFLWDVPTGRLERVLRGHEERVTWLAFSPDGRLLASASFDKTVKLWDTTTGRETITLRGHSDHVWGLAFTPDGRRLASASGDNTVRIWNAIPPLPDDKNPFEVFTLSLDAPDIHAVDLSPDGRRLAWAGVDPTVIHVWDVSRRQVVQTLRGHTKPISVVAFSRDGLHLAATSEEADALIVWDLKSEQTIGHEGIGYAAGLALSPDGRYFASSTNHYHVRCHEVRSGQEIGDYIGHTVYISCLLFSPDGRRLASGGFDQTVKIWDIASGREVVTFREHQGRVWALAFSPSGRQFASGGNDTTVKIWDTTTGEERLILRGHTGAVRAVAYGPDGEYLASVGQDRTVKVWDVQNGKELLTLRGHTGRVRLVTFSADGSQLLSVSEGSGKAELKVWSLPSLAKKHQAGAE